MSTRAHIQWDMLKDWKFCIQIDGVLYPVDALVSKATAFATFYYFSKAARPDRT
jgi:hypothetical protein